MIRTPIRKALLTSAVGLAIVLQSQFPALVLAGPPERNKETPPPAAVSIPEPTAQDLVKLLFYSAVALGQQAQDAGRPDIAQVWNSHAGMFESMYGQSQTGNTAREFLRAGIAWFDQLRTQALQAGDERSSQQLQAIVELFIDQLQQHDRAFAAGGKWNEIRCRFPQGMLTAFFVNPPAVDYGAGAVQPATGDPFIDQLNRQMANAHRIYSEGMEIARQNGVDVDAIENGPGFVESLVESSRQATDAIAHPERYTPAERERILRRANGYARAVKFNHGSTLYQQTRNRMNWLEAARRHSSHVRQDVMNTWEAVNNMGGGGLVRD